MIPLIVLALSIVVSNPAFAADVKKDMAACTAIEAALARLDCYDDAADAAGLGRTKSAHPRKIGRWSLESKKNPLDDTKTVTGVLVTHDVTSKWGRPISLVLRCRSNRMEASIDWGSYLGKEAPEVLIRIGDAEAIKERWGISTDRESTVYSGDSIEFVKSLERNRKLVAQVTPYLDNPATAIFDLSGIEKITRALKETCEWDSAPTRELGFKSSR